jgi:signal transduction histidine kinase/3D (Asp-Asp-Asp) domain-containing protein
MKFPIPIGVDSALGRRLVGLSFFRLAVLGIFLGLLQLYYLPIELGGLSSMVGIATVAFACTTTAVYALTLRRERWLEAMAHVQLITDQLTWTAIVYISGGVTSGAASLYGLTCLSGAILLGTVGALSAAAAGASCYLALCVGFAQGWLQPPSDQTATYLTLSNDMVYPAFSTVLAMVVVTLLGSYLAERLRAFGGELALANRRAVEAERLAALGRLAAGLAHEIRNPLGSIRGSIELLRTGGALSSEDRRLCRIIEQETARLNQLVTDMVDLSRPRDPTMHEIDLANVVTSVVALAESSARGEDVTVRYQGPVSLTVVADRGQMHQVLWNLVRNAMQVSAAQTEVLVRLESTSDGSVLLGVLDSGPGIPEVDHERVFDAFFTTQKHGVGIGLAVVKQIVDGHGFEIDVKSGLGAGSTFSVRIPKARVVTATLALVALGTLGCAGNAWVRNDPAPAQVGNDDGWSSAEVKTAAPAAASTAEPVGSSAPEEPPEPLGAVAIELSGSRAGSGLYRNTYYYFPEEPSYPESGETRELFDAECKSIRTVSQDFHDRLCVQGSGRLASNETVSFAKRGCDCAAECPRTGQKICYELLDKAAFPFGRGATGKAITPLRTVAVDSDAIPLGTVLYIPDYNGLRDREGAPHDGCFVAADRGSKVKGKHVDIFAGTLETAGAWNVAVPSNRGVQVVLGASQCRWLAPKGGKTAGKNR